MQTRSLPFYALLIMMVSINSIPVASFSQDPLESENLTKKIFGKIQSLYGFHRFRNCGLMLSYDFSKELKEKKEKRFIGKAIEFKKNWGGWDNDEILFRNGLVGNCEAIPAFVREGTEAKIGGKIYKYSAGNWQEIYTQE